MSADEKSLNEHTGMSRPIRLGIGCSLVLVAIAVFTFVGFMTAIMVYPEARSPQEAHAWTIKLIQGSLIGALAGLLIGLIFASRLNALLWRHPPGTTHSPANSGDTPL